MAESVRTNIVMKRFATLIFIAIGLAAPAWGQTIYALRERVIVPLPPDLPAQYNELVQITNTDPRSAQLSPPLITMPAWSHIAAFDAVKRRVFLVIQGDDHLNIADLQTKSLTRSGVVTTGRTFAFDSSNDTLYAADGAQLMAVELAGGTATTVLAADRPIVLCGLDPARGRVFVSDPGGGELRYVDLSAHTLSNPLLTVNSSVSVTAETDRDVVDILYNSTYGAAITLFDMVTGTSTAIGFPGADFIIATANALDTQSGHVYAVRGEDWHLFQLLTFDVRKGTISGAFLSGDWFEVIVAPDAPPKRRAIRTH
jgi:hypothetical protein